MLSPKQATSSASAAATHPHTTTNAPSTAVLAFIAPTPVLKAPGGLLSSTVGTEVLHGERLRADRDDPGPIPFVGRVCRCLGLATLLLRPRLPAAVQPPVLRRVLPDE